MRVMVTGHKGYVGAVLVPLLQERDHEVIGVDCDLFEECSFSPSAPAERSIEKDIRDLTEADFIDIDAVILNPGRYGIGRAEVAEIGLNPDVYTLAASAKKFQGTGIGEVGQGRGGHPIRVRVHVGQGAVVAVRR